MANAIKKVYLAGFDVFHHNAVELGEAFKAKCAAVGLEGLFPLDNELELTGPTPQYNATSIFTGNIEMLKSADAVLANLNPFRGLEPDSGTITEVAVAWCNDLLVFGYMQDRRPMIDKIIHHNDGTDLMSGAAIEDFNLPLNLMPMNMLYDYRVSESFDAAIQEVLKYNRINEG